MTEASARRVYADLIRGETSKRNESMAANAAGIPDVLAGERGRMSGGRADKIEWRSNRCRSLHLPGLAQTWRHREKCLRPSDGDDAVAKEIEINTRPGKSVTRVWISAPRTRIGSRRKKGAFGVGCVRRVERGGDSRPPIA